jgi:hypothetical protein
LVNNFEVGVLGSGLIDGVHTYNEALMNNSGKALEQRGRKDGGTWNAYMVAERD